MWQSNVIKNWILVAMGPVKKLTERPTGRMESLRYHSYRSPRNKAERRRILVKVNEEQKEMKVQQQKFRRLVREVLLGNPREGTKKWWNNVVRESSVASKSMLVRKLFGRVRHSDVGRILRPLLHCFQSLEKEILNAVEKRKKRYMKSCRGAKNLGLSLGCTFVAGHKKIYAKSPFQRENQGLVNELKSVVNMVFEEAFGSEDWYIKLKKCVHDAVFSIHGQEGLDCLFGGLPISCVWLSLVPEGNVAHVDVNAGPASFVMTTTNCDSGDLIISSPVDGTKRRILLKPGYILGGSWALFKHWNLQVGPSSSRGGEELNGERHSWVFYLNRNILNIGDWTIAD